MPIKIDASQSISKAGEQSSSNPFDFILSTASVDRMGDIVEQDWQLGPFRKNPIALSQHSSGLPIGTWKNVRVSAGKLLGRLELAEKGTSEYIDVIRSLIEQRILRTVSVGFRPGKVEAIDEKDPWGGLRLSKNELLECSVVSVPANPEALSLAKSLSDTDRQRLFGEPADDIDVRSAYAQLGLSKSQSRDSEQPLPKPPTPERTTMSLSQKIEAKQAYIVEQRDMLANLTSELSDDITDEQTAQMEELSASITKAETDLATLVSAENSLAARTVERKSAATAEVDSDEPAQRERAPRFSGGRRNREKGYDLFAAATCLLKGHIDNVSPYDIAKQHFKSDERELNTMIRGVLDPKSVFTRAESAPAMSTTVGWAQELVQDNVGEFLELVRDVSIYPRVPGMRMQFDAYGSITMPRNDGRGLLAGDFVGEGKPLAVKQGLYGSTDLTPKEYGVISSFTKKVARHSIPAIQSLVRTQLIADTAESLDARFLDAEARSVIRPAGLQDATETGAGNINASGGATVADVIADTTGAIQRLITSRTADGALWLINPLRVVGLRSKQDAASGAFPFRAEIAAGTLAGYPFLASQNIPTDTVFLIGGSAMAHGNDIGVQIDVSDEATLVMEDDSSLVEDVTEPGVAQTMATVSMFQVQGVALKLTAGLDWRIVRSGGVQVLTSVAW